MRYIIAKIEKGGFSVWVQAATENLNTNQMTFISDAGIEGDRCIEFREFGSEKEMNEYYLSVQPTSGSESTSGSPTSGSSYSEERKKNIANGNKRNWEKRRQKQKEHKEYVRGLEEKVERLEQEIEDLKGELEFYINNPTPEKINETY